MTSIYKYGESEGRIFKHDEIYEYIYERLTEEPQMLDWEPVEILHELFNTGYYIIGTFQAHRWLGNNAFHAIRTIKEYETCHFGEVYTDLTDPEKVCNMYAYIIGENIIFNDLDYWIEEAINEKNN